MTEKHAIFAKKEELKDIDIEISKLKLMKFYLTYVEYSENEHAYIFIFTKGKEEETK